MYGITRVVLIRHVASTWSDKGVLQGMQNPPLSDEGMRQLPGVAAIAKQACADRPAEIISSGLLRALDTARFLSSSMGDIPLHVHGELREMSFGVWEGRPEASLADDPSLKQRYDLVDVEFCWPGATETLRERAHLASDLILSRVQSYPDITTIVVSHGLLLQATLAELLFNDMQFARTCELAAGSVSILDHNGTAGSFVARWIGVPWNLCMPSADNGQ